MKLESGLFRTPCSSIKPARGCLLVSEPLLTDSYFQRSVIFLIEHNTEGTMGLVLNKPSGLVLNPVVEIFAMLISEKNITEGLKRGLCGDWR